MEIIELNADNLSEHKDILDEDVSESIGRKCYHGIVSSEDGDFASGALIWEYRSSGGDAGVSSELSYICSGTKEDTDALLDEYLSKASKENVLKTTFETPVLSEEVSECFKEHGFMLKTDESRDIRVSVFDLSGIASKVKKIPGNIVALDEINDIRFMQGITNCIFNGKKGLMEDLEYIKKKWYAQDVSCCVITDDKVSGMFLIHRFPSGTLMPVLLAAIGPDARKDILHMICFSAKKALDLYPKDTEVMIRRHNAPVRALTQNLFPDRTGDTVLCGELKH